MRPLKKESHELKHPSEGILRRGQLTGAKQPPSLPRAEAKSAADVLTKILPRRPKQHADNLDQAIRALPR